MRKIQELKPIRHAMIWIIAYIVLVNVGDMISELIGVPNSATSAILIAYTVCKQKSLGQVLRTSNPQERGLSKIVVLLPIGNYCCPSIFQRN